MGRCKRKIGRLLVLVLALWMAQTPNAQDEMPSIFVGAQLREGFLDIDVGIHDSIRDLQRGLKRAGIPLASGREDATLVLVVLARGIVTQGSVGFSSGSAAAGTGTFTGFVIPNSKPTLTTILRVGAYEKMMQSEAGTWTGAAMAAIDDVMVWWDANEDAVRNGLTRVPERNGPR